MKKVLFATTALVATAGVAAADIAITGGAEMGIVGGSDDAQTLFHQSVDVRFRMTGEADNGLMFGAQIDLDDLDDPVDVQGDFADFTVFISGQFGTLTMGDTDGAFDWALQEVNLGSPGSINDDDTAHDGYNGNAGLDGVEDFDGQVLRYDYSFGDFGVALSAEVDDSPEDEVVWGIGFRYNFDFAGGSAGIGLGYQTTDDFGDDAVTPLRFAGGDQGRDIIGISLSTELDNGLSAAINYSSINGTGNGTIDFDGVGPAVAVDASDVDGEHMGIGVSYTFDAITLHANYGEFDWDSDSGVADAEGFGLAASYDFGGGLTGHFGYGYSDTDGADDFSTYSLGLAMSF